MDRIGCATATRLSCDIADVNACCQFALGPLSTRAIRFFIFALRLHNVRPIMHCGDAKPHNGDVMFASVRECMCRGFDFTS